MKQRAIKPTATEPKAILTDITAPESAPVVSSAAAARSSSLSAEAVGVALLAVSSEASEAAERVALALALALALPLFDMDEADSVELSWNCVLEIQHISINALKTFLWQRHESVQQQQESWAWSIESWPGSRTRCRKARCRSLRPRVVGTRWRALRRRPSL